MGQSDSQNIGVPFPRDTNVLRPSRDYLKICTLATFILLPLIWLVEIVWGENTAISALLLYFPQHYFFFLPIILTLASLIKWRPRVLLFNLLSIAFCLVIPMGIQLHLPTNSNNQIIRLVTFNIQRGEGDEPGVEKTLHALAPDIICLQESGLSSDLGKNSVGRHISLGFLGWNARYAGDVTTLSKFPIVSERVHPLPGTRSTLETVLQTRSGPVRVLNTHVSTSFAGERVPKSKLDRLALLYETARPSAQVRLQQLPQLQAAVNSGTPNTPLILAGDFNTPPRGHFYGGLARHLTDAFAQAGNGLGLTFPSRFPLLRIDYVWTSRVRAKHVWVENPGGSDHRPLVADLEVSA